MNRIKPKYKINDKILFKKKNYHNDMAFNYKCQYKSNEEGYILELDYSIILNTNTNRYEPEEKHQYYLILAAAQNEYYWLEETDIVEDLIMDITVENWNDLL